MAHRAARWPRRCRRPRTGRWGTRPRRSASTARSGRSPSAPCTNWYRLTVVESWTVTSPGPAPMSGASRSPTCCGLVDPLVPRPDQAGRPLVAQHLVHPLEGAQRRAPERVAVEVDQFVAARARRGQVELFAPRGQWIGGIEGERVVTGDHRLSLPRSIRPPAARRRGRSTSRVCPWPRPTRCRLRSTPTTIPFRPDAELSTNRRRFAIGAALSAVALVAVGRTRLSRPASCRCPRRLRRMFADTGTDGSDPRRPAGP